MFNFSSNEKSNHKYVQENDERFVQILRITWDFPTNLKVNWIRNKFHFSESESWVSWEPKTDTQLANLKIKWNNLRQQKLSDMNIKLKVEESYCIFHEKGQKFGQKAEANWPDDVQRLQDLSAA